MVAGLSAAVAVALVSGAIVSGYFAANATVQRTLADQKTEEALANAKIAEAATKSEASGRAQAESRETEARRRLYLANMGLAHEAWKSGMLDRLTQLLEAAAPQDGHDYRGFEYYYYNRRLSDSRIRTFVGHQDTVRRIAFNSDGTTIASASLDASIRLWNVSDGSQLKQLQVGSPAYSVALSPDRSLVAAGGLAVVRVWDVATGNERHLLRGHSRHVWSVDFAPDGSTLASSAADGTVRLWDVFTGECKAVLSYPFGGHPGFESVQFSPDGKTLAAGGGLLLTPGLVKLWDAATHEEIAAFRAHDLSIECIAFAPDGKRLATGAQDNRAKLWEIPSGREVGTFTGHGGWVTSLAFSGDGTLLATSSPDRTVRLWDVATCQQRAALRAHSDSVQDVKFAPDGNTIASCGSDKTIKLWSVSSQTEYQTIGHSQSASDANVHGAASSGSGRPAPRREFVSAVDFSRGGDVFAMGNYSEGEPSKICVAFAKEHNKLAEITLPQGENGYLCRIAISPDGRYLAAGTGPPFPFFQRPRLPGRAFVWELSNLTRPPVVLNGHTTGVSSVAFSPDGTTIVTGGLDSAVQLWNAVTGESITRLASLPGTFSMSHFPGMHDWLRLHARSRDRTRV